MKLVLSGVHAKILPMEDTPKNQDEVPLDGMLRATQTKHNPYNKRKIAAKTPFTDPILFIVSFIGILD